MGRFEFGKNWLNFLSVVTEEHISEAMGRLADLLGDIRNKTFLDVGCGSGIHSLAAARLGAARVHSFDYDPGSVECALEMRRRFAPDAKWSIESGSALDEGYLRSLGHFDIVYSWGVLHHTGEMWKALNLITIPANSRIAICLYKDQGVVSRGWRALKRAYVNHPFIRPAVTMASLATIWGPKVLLQPHRVIPDWKNWKRKRGMSPWHDVVDWAGGFPYEFANSEAVIQFFNQQGFHLETLRPFGRIIRMYEYVLICTETRSEGHSQSVEGVPVKDLTASFPEH